MDLVAELLRLVRVNGTATVGHSGAPRLDGFPLLVYTAAGVCTEDNQTLVADICVAVCGPARPGFAEVAERFATTEAHVRQALGYAVSTGLVGV